jgi:O-methyltransferase
MFLSKLKAGIRRRLEYRLHHKPLVHLVIDNLYAYLDALEKTSALSGAVVEIGCAQGHTSAIATTFMARRGTSRRYLCVDTFAGFTNAHIESERAIRQFDRSLATSFQDTKLEEVRANFSKWGVPGIETFKGDISSFDLAAAVNGKISVAMVDVDLFQPCYDGIQKSFDLLDDRGVIIVDDVTQKEWRGADIAYRKFCDENHMEPRYYCSFGVIEKTKGTTGWAMRDTPGADCPYHFNPRVPVPSHRTA